jgi:hypothetical protein
MAALELRIAVEKGDCDKMRELLEDGGASVANERTTDTDKETGAKVQVTALVAAVANNQHAAVNLLLAHGAICEANSDGSTPLMEGASRGHLEILQTLLGNETSSAMDAVRPTDNGTAFYYACLKDHAECAVELARHGCDMKLRAKDGMTGEEIAQHKKHTAVLEGLRVLALQKLRKELPKGSIVILANFEKAVHHNGKQAEVLSFDAAKQRYVVRLWSPTGRGQKVKVKPENAVQTTAATAVQKCTRCLGDSRQGKCQIPHPVHHRTSLASRFSGSSARTDYDCEACGAEYTEVVQQGANSFIPKHSCQWCFEGEHTTEPMTDDEHPGLRLPRGRHDGRCRILPDEMHLTHGPDLQEQINAIAKVMPDVRVLTITDPSGSFDDSNKNLITLNHKLPQLTLLHLLDVPFERITLNNELTPNLSILKLKNVPDGSHVLKPCNLEVQCNKLSVFSILYWKGEARIINKMLAAATKLRFFDSYKLWIIAAAEDIANDCIDISKGNLAFASNQLQSIDLHRADSLPSLSIWAPNLTFREKPLFAHRFLFLLW